MTIEEFEKEVKDLFIEKGWQLMHTATWFTVAVISIYRHKHVTVIRHNDGRIWDAHSENFPGAFHYVLQQIKETL